MTGSFVAAFWGKKKKKNVNSSICLKNMKCLLHNSGSSVNKKKINYFLLCIKKEVFALS